ncbi:MAG: nucleoside triphosphate pyrophosphohydrolase, partial [Deltaproteobacteria bacterium]
MERRGIDALKEIMARLRGEGGCPWDRKQTFESLKPFLIEEAYEVVEAIDRGDWEGLKEELGDLLFLIVFLAHIAQEKGLFDLEGVMEGVAGKIIRRHPHVFQHLKISSPEEVEA